MEKLRIYTFDIKDVPDSATYSTFTLKGVTGIPRSYSYLGTAMTWKLETGIGYGMSQDAAKTLVGEATNDGADAAITATYLGEDRLIAYFKHTSTGVTGAGILKVIVEQ